MEEKTEKSQADIEWENRVLCSDGNCIGIIGPDGRCKECGLRYDGDLPVAIPENGDVAESSPPREDETAAEHPKGSVAPINDDEWENRQLCADGNCIGVIGPDGRCKECGRPHEP